MPHELLSQLYLEDIADRQQVTNWSDPAQVQRIQERDLQRLKKVKQLVETSQLSESEDYYHAAFIYQHGQTLDDYQQAYHLARESMNRGYEPAKWMYASTLDRWNLAMGKPQFYGTQFTHDLSGEWKLAGTIEERVTDEERAKYNVPPLAKAVEEFKKRNQGK
jgi:hypothetical protein